MDAALLELCTEEIYLKPRAGVSVTGVATYDATVGPIMAYVTTGRTKQYPKMESSVVTGGMVYFDGAAAASIPNGSRVVLPDGSERPIKEVHSWSDERSPGDIDHWRITFGE